MKHFIACLVLALALTFPTFVYAQADISTPASHAYLIDLQTGSVLLDKKADERMPTSSMSKVMTAYAVFQALKEGRINLNDTMNVSEKAWKKGGSKMFVEVGKDIKVKDLLRGVIVQSGNDATIVLAEGLAGSEDVFAQTITRIAKNIGMTNSQFRNASGWPDPDHYSTAHDLAVLAERTIKDFPEYYAYYAEKEFTYNDIKQPNRNPLLYRKMGVDGIKTGHTEIGGYGLMASAMRDDRRLILVVNGLESEKQRANESARLLEWAFSTFENKHLFAGGDVIAEAEVVMGLEKTVSLVVKEDIFVSINKQKKDDIKVLVKYTAPLVAPFAQDAKVGVLEVQLPDMPLQKYDLYTAKGVAELGLIPKTMAKIKFFLMGRL